MSNRECHHQRHHPQYLLPPLQPTQHYSQISNSLLLLLISTCCLSCNIMQIYRCTKSKQSLCIAVLSKTSASSVTGGTPSKYVLSRVDGEAGCSTEVHTHRHTHTESNRESGGDRQYLLSDPSCWYGDTSVLNVDSVSAFDSWRILDADSTIVAVDDSRHYLTGCRNIDHATRGISRSCIRLV